MYVCTGHFNKQLLTYLLTYMYYIASCVCTHYTYVIILSHNGLAGVVNDGQHWISVMCPLRVRTQVATHAEPVAVACRPIAWAIVTETP